MVSHLVSRKAGQTNKGFLGRPDMQDKRQQQWLIYTKSLLHDSVSFDVMLRKNVLHEPNSHLQSTYIDNARFTQDPSRVERTTKKSVFEWMKHERLKV